MLVACAAGALVIALPVVVAGGALETAQRAAGVADAAALASADAALGWIPADPCGIAGDLAAAAGMELGECVVNAHSGVARVTVTAWTGFGVIEARALAGPVESA